MSVYQDVSHFASPNRLRAQAQFNQTAPTMSKTPPPLQKAPGRELFGQIALKKGFISEHQLDDALSRQKQLKQSGQRHELLGLIMIEINVLSNAQLIEILKYIEAQRGEHME